MDNITRKLITSFMDFFNSIYLQKFMVDDTTGELVPRRTYKVPVQYAARDKFIDVLQSSSARKMMPAEDSIAPVELQWILPRISVYLNGVVYDTERHLNKLNKITSGEQFLYAPVPYNLEIEVSTISKTQNESYQIMEQILPYFAPGMSIDVKVINDTPESIPIILNSVSFDYNTDLPEAEERLHIVNYSYTMRANYYIPPKASNKILHVNASFNNLNIDPFDTLFEQYLSNASNPFPNRTSVAASNLKNDLIKWTLQDKGNWDKDSKYKIYDLINYDDYKYVYIGDGKTNPEPTVDANWQYQWTMLNVINKLGFNVTIH